MKLISSYPTPAQLKKAGKTRIAAKLKANGAKLHTAWADQIVQALAKQSVTVAGTQAAGTVLPHLAQQLIALHAQRNDVATQVEHLVQAHPLFMGPTSMPGTGSPDRSCFPRRDPGQDLPHRSPPSLLRRSNPGNQTLGQLHQR